MEGLFDAIEQHSHPVMDVYVVRDRARVVKRRQIDVEYIEQYDVYRKSPLFEFSRVPF